MTPQEFACVASLSCRALLQEPKGIVPVPDAPEGPTPPSHPPRPVPTPGPPPTNPIPGQSLEPRE